MPKLDVAQRRVRDALVFDLWLAGESVRAIGGRPDVRLSPRGVLLAVQRQMRGPMDAARLEALFADAYTQSLAGDEKGAMAVRRLMAAMGAGAESVEPEEAAESEDAVVPGRRRGTLSVPINHYVGLNDVLALAQDKARGLAGGAPVDVRLESSHEYQNTVEWVFTYEVGTT